MSTSVRASPRGLGQLNGTMPEWAERADGSPGLAFVDSCLRGVGQVCFMNNPVTGLAILVAMAVGEVWLGFAGILGLVTSTGSRSSWGWTAGRSGPGSSASTASSWAPGCRCSWRRTGTSW